MKYRINNWDELRDALQREDYVVMLDAGPAGGEEAEVIDYTVGPEAYPDQEWLDEEGFADEEEWYQAYRGTPAIVIDRPMGQGGTNTRILDTVEVSDFEIYGVRSGKYDDEMYENRRVRRSSRKSLREGTLTAEDIIQDEGLIDSIVKQVQDYCAEIIEDAEDRIGLQASVRKYRRNCIDWALPKTTEFINSDEYYRAEDMLDDIVEERLYEGRKLKDRQKRLREARRRNLKERQRNSRRSLRESFSRYDLPCRFGYFTDQVENLGYEVNDTERDNVFEVVDTDDRRISFYMRAKMSRDTIYDYKFYYDYNCRNEIEVGGYPLKDALRAAGYHATGIE